VEPPSFANPQQTQVDYIGVQSLPTLPLLFAVGKNAHMTALNGNDHRFCYECGTQVNPPDFHDIEPKFCFECGTKVERVHMGARTVRTYHRDPRRNGKCKYDNSLGGGVQRQPFPGDRP
jgi:hypothetical protein